jgi:hypothetical protein
MQISCKLFLLMSYWKHSENKFVLLNKFYVCGFKLFFIKVHIIAEKMHFYSYDILNQIWNFSQMHGIIVLCFVIFVFFLFGV